MGSTLQKVFSVVKNWGKNIGHTIHTPELAELLVEEDTHLQKKVWSFHVRNPYTFSSQIAVSFSSRLIFVTKLRQSFCPEELIKLPI